MILIRHLRRHRWFYLALCAAIISFAPTGGEPLNARIAVTGDIFYVVYLVLVAAFEVPASPQRFRTWAGEEDEGLLLIAVITLTVVAFSLASIFSFLNAGKRPDAILLLVALTSAPLGWFVLHTSASLHYANYYYGRNTGEPAAHGGLNFPDTDEPGFWEFLYYAFVVGMTAQVSDVQVTTTRMRRLTLAHSIISFFYNTVLIAMAVNVIVALAQASNKP